MRLFQVVASAPARGHLASSSHQAKWCCGPRNFSGRSAVKAWASAPEGKRSRPRLAIQRGRFVAAGEGEQAAFALDHHPGDLVEAGGDQGDAGLAVFPRARPDPFGAGAGLAEAARRRRSPRSARARRSAAASGSIWPPCACHHHSSQDRALRRASGRDREAARGAAPGGRTTQSRAGRRALRRGEITGDGHASLMARTGGGAVRRGQPRRRGGRRARAASCRARRSPRRRSSGASRPRPTVRRPIRPSLRS